MNSPTLDQNDTINIINPPFLKKECNGIGNKKKWTKLCPDCNKEMFFSSKYYLKHSEEFNMSCRKCGCKKKKIDRHIKEQYVGQKFFNLTITKQYVGENNKTMADCLCDCGNIKTYQLCEVVHGRKESCGCLRKIRAQEACRKKSGWSAFMQIYNSYKTRSSRG